MSSYLLGMTLLAVAWLVLWVGKDHSRPSKTWWPFAMREIAPKKTPGSGPEQARLLRRNGAGGSSQRPWRRSGF
jgi:hypothetical protein